MNTKENITQEKIYVIADIHGCLDKLNALLLKLDITPNTTFIFTGDYVDRGPNSYGVIERLIELDNQCTCIFICGNHDQMFFDGDKFRSDHAPSNRYSLWSQGARETYDSYKDAGVKPEVHYEFYKKLEPYYVLELNDKKHLFVHGGYNRHKLLEEQKNNNVFWWDRDLIMAAYSYNSMKNNTHTFKNKDNFDYIYVGHTPVQYWDYTEPQLWGNVWAMDTGVGKYEDAKLYALEIITQTLIG